jgi:hypothetical protein
MSVRTHHPGLAAWLASSGEASGPGRTESGMLGRYGFRPVIFTSSALPFSTGVYTNFLSLKG